MYKRQQPVVEDDELIDISSDDSNDATAPCSTSSDKPTNGASTSQKNKSVLLAIPAFANSINKGVARALREIPTPLVTLEKAKKRKSDGMVVGSPKVGHKRAKILQTIQEPSVCFKDIGGMDKVLEHLCTLLVHIKHPEIYRQIGISPPRGFLLHGPPGCGKTLLANAIAGVSYLFPFISYPKSYTFFAYFSTGVSKVGNGFVRNLECRFSKWQLRNWWQECRDKARRESENCLSGLSL